MKPLYIMCLWFCLLISGCTVSDRIDNRNFAFDTYYPTLNEIRLAEQRGQRYWQNNSQRFPNSTWYLAVYTTNVLQGDADHWLAGTVTWQGISDGESDLK
jgi:hypothetical protein